MKKLNVIICIVCFTVCFGALNATRFARWSTSMGSFTAELYDQETPITAGNFISLANSGFYNDLIFHRVVHGFVIQDGCPYGTGYGGPGYTIPDEVYPGFHHDQAGILAMAKTSAPNSAGSQYYFTLAPAPHLDGTYAIFGKVVQGLDVVLAIGDVPVDANSHPLTPVTIDTLRILDLAIGTLTPPNNDTFLCQTYVSQMFIVEASAVGSIPQYTWFKDGALVPEATDFIFETAFEIGTHNVECVVSTEDWAHTIHWDVYAHGLSVEDDTVPVPPELRVYPNPFHEGVRISAKVDGGEALSVSIYDVRGRKVYTGIASGRSILSMDWDGKDSSGLRCASGVYIIRMGNSFARCLLY